MATDLPTLLEHPSPEWRHFFEKVVDVPIFVSWWYWKINPLIIQSSQNIQPFYDLGPIQYTLFASFRIRWLYQYLASRQVLIIQRRWWIFPDELIISRSWSPWKNPCQAHLSGIFRVRQLDAGPSPSCIDRGPSGVVAFCAHDVFLLLLLKWEMVGLWWVSVWFANNWEMNEWGKLC